MRGKEVDISWENLPQIPQKWQRLMDFPIFVTLIPKVKNSELYRHLF
jgi:hypothetical protein